MVILKPLERSLCNSQQHVSAAIYSFLCLILSLRINDANFTIASAVQLSFDSMRWFMDFPKVYYSQVVCYVDVILYTPRKIETNCEVVPFNCGRLQYF